MKAGVLKPALYGLLLVIVYMFLQPHLFGPATTTFSLSTEQHALLIPPLRYANGFHTISDPAVRMWFAEFDLYHNPHFNFRYPFYFTWLGEGGNLVETSHRYFLVTHLHFILGGLGAFVLALSLGVRPVAAFAAGLFFALAYNNTLLAPFFTRLASSSWTPWALTGVWLAASGRNPTLGVAIGVPAVALLVFASATQPLLYFVFMSVFVGLAGLYYGWQSLRDKALFLKNCVRPSAILAVLSLCMALPALLPVLFEQSEYVRWTRSGPVVGSYKVAFEDSLDMAMNAQQGIHNLFAPVRGPFSVGSSFIGTITALLVLAAFSVRRFRVLAILMLIVGMYFVINGMGQTTFVPKITYQIPYLNNIRQLTSHYVLINLAAIILFAFAWNYLFEKGRHHKFRIFAGALVTGLLAWYFLNRDSSLLNNAPHAVKVSLFVVPVCIFAMIWLKNDKLKEVVLVIMAIAATIPHAYLREIRNTDLTKLTYYTDETSHNTIKAWEEIAKVDPRAVVGVELGGKLPNGRPINARRLASIAVYEDLRPFRIYMSPHPVEEFRHFSKLNNSPSKMADRGLQYFVTNIENHVDPERFELFKSLGTVNIFRTKNPVGRLNRQCDIFPEKGACKAELSIQERSEGNMKFSYDLELSVADNLVFYGFQNDKWRAYLNGDKLPISWLEKDHLSVNVPAGEHNLRFVYKDARQSILWIIFWMGFLLFAGFLFRERPRLSPSNLPEEHRTKTG